MAGVFDIMNHPGTGEYERTCSPAFLSGIFMMRVAAIRTGAELRTMVETELQRTLTDQEVSELLDWSNHINAGTGEAGILARIQRFESVAGIWESGQGGITEAEARSMSGVTFS